jgi:hypothetical protein
MTADTVIGRFRLAQKNTMFGTERYGFPGAAFHHSWGLGDRQPADIRPRATRGVGSLSRPVQGLLAGVGYGHEGRADGLWPVRIALEALTVISVGRDG